MVGDRDQLAANVDLVDGLLSPPGGARDFVRRQVLGPANTALWDRAVHAAKVLVRFALTLRRVCGGRPWRPLPPSVQLDGS